jgi:hypothetical protein
MEDIRWKQRAKQNWYKHGDRNTKYFHAWENQWRRKNRIESIMDQNGKEWSQHEEIGVLSLTISKTSSPQQGPRGWENVLQECSPG